MEIYQGQDLRGAAMLDAAPKGTILSRIDAGGTYIKWTPFPGRGPWYTVVGQKWSESGPSRAYGRDFRLTEGITLWGNASDRMPGLYWVLHVGTGEWPPPSAFPEGEAIPEPVALNAALAAAAPRRRNAERGFDSEAGEWNTPWYDPERLTEHPKYTRGRDGEIRVFDVFQPGYDEPGMSAWAGQIGQVWRRRGGRYPQWVTIQDRGFAPSFMYRDPLTAARRVLYNVIEEDWPSRNWGGGETVYPPESWER